MTEEKASKQPAGNPEPVAPAVTPKPKTVEKTIEIKLSVPAYDFKSVIIPAWLHIQSKVLLVPRRILLVSGGVGLLLVTSYATYQILSLHTPATTAEVASTTQSTPDYPTKLPAGKTIESLGGWKPSYRPGSNPAFAYADKIGKNAITVIQQPLPEAFKKDTTQKINQLAVSSNATEKVTVGHNTAYIATLANGSQSVILNMDNLLILITSRTHIDTNEWASYINSLK